MISIRQKINRRGVFFNRVKNSAWGKTSRGPESKKSTHPTSIMNVGCVDFSNSPDQSVNRFFVARYGPRICADGIQVVYWVGACWRELETEKKRVEEGIPHTHAFQVRPGTEPKRPENKTKGGKVREGILSE